MSNTGHAGGYARPEQGELRRATIVAALLSILVCALFALVASFALTVSVGLSGIVDEPGLLGRLGVKSAVFLVLTGIAGFGLFRFSRGYLPDKFNAPKNSGTPYVALAGILIVVALLVFPRLFAYPWAAPDELHHLTVARNLADYGAYASGHPDAGLIYFDRYDSIGPALIAPVALSFQVFGTRYEVARAVVGVFYIMLALAVFMFMTKTYGRRAALLSVVFVTCAFSSIYLARSVYGEVPALFFFMAGLLAWRRSFAGGSVFAALAGVLFGLAVLTKSFVILGGCAVVIAWFFDRMTLRRISWGNVALMSCGFVGVYAAWMIAQVPFRHLVADDAPLMLYYRHYLMFGLGSFGTALRWFVEHPLTSLTIVVSFAIALPAAVSRRTDPAALALLLTGVLFAFWWCFFTPGNTPRYLWYTCAIGAMFAAPVFLQCLERIHAAQQPRLLKPACLAFVAIVAIGSASHGLREVHGIFATDVMQPERDVAAFVRSAPEHARIGTTFWPMERFANFLADRPIDLVEADDSGHDLVIVNTRLDEPARRTDKSGRRIGHYTIFGGDS